MPSFIGIDPGLVHTAGVAVQASHSIASFTVHTKVVDGISDSALAEMAEWALAVKAEWGQEKTMDAVAIEGYRPRGHYQGDSNMMQAIKHLQTQIPGSSQVPNMGVKKVITNDTLKLLRLWNFQPKTHHQDLRSAARIGMFHCAQVPSGSEWLYDIIKSVYKSTIFDKHLTNNRWLFQEINE